jgi:hypothetical protein
VDESASNVITVLDPHEIERAGISQAFHLPPPQMMTMMNGHPGAAFDSMNQSFYYQQSLLSHDVQSELMNLTESINKITERPESGSSPQKKYKSVLSGKSRAGGGREEEENKGRNDRSFDVKVARTHSPSPTRSSHRQPTNSSSSKEKNNNNSSNQNNRPSSPTRSLSPSRRPYPSSSSSSFLQTNDVRKIEELIMDLNMNYHKEIAAMHSSILNIANHYSKLENHFNVVYEKKILYKFSELENRIMKLEEMMFYKDNQYHGPSGVLPLPLRGMKGTAGAGDEEEKNNHFQTTMNERVVQQLSKSVFQQNEQIAQQQHHMDNLAMRSTSASSSAPLGGAMVGDSSSDPVMVDELTNRLEIIEKMIELQKEKEIQQKLQLLSTQSAAARVPQNNNHHHNHQNQSSPKDSKKEKLLQQLSYLDHQIAQEKFDSDLNNINQENILRLSTSRSVDTSPLSASAMNTPHHHFPAHPQNHLQTIQDPLNDNHHLGGGEDERVASFSPVPNHNDSNANIPRSSSGDLYFQNSLSNLNRFQRIAALHNTLNQHQINNPPPPLSHIGGPSSEYETINNEELTSPTDLRSNASSSKNTRRTSASGKQQQQPTPTSTGKNVNHHHPSNNNRNKESGAPEYYYETLLPPTFQSQQQQPQQQQQTAGGQKRKDEKRDFSPNKHFQRIHNPTEQQQEEDRPRQQLRSSPARETHSLQHVSKGQMRNSGKSFMGSTRAAELKRNPSNQRLPHDKTFL